MHKNRLWMAFAHAPHRNRLQLVFRGAATPRDRSYEEKMRSWTSVEVF